MLSSRKRLAINTIILYTKLIITVIISFVTSRLILNALGVSDYGLYNVVGGVVSMLNILGLSMSSTSSRYMSVEIGKGVNGNPNKVYNTIFTIHLALAIFLIFFGGAVGTFYVDNYLNVAPDRIDDALFVMYISLATTAFGVITVPMNGLIIARERFLFTSIIEIISTVAKLLFVIALVDMNGDKLRLYATGLALVQIFTPLSYQVYCRINDRQIIKWNFNRIIKEYYEMLSFAGWLFIGTIACMASVQGASVIINWFFGTTLNAAFGLATQVFNATTQFTRTIRQAANPQIMKSQSAGEHDKSLNLVYLISRYSFLFMLIPGIPIIVSINGILKLWLGTPPLYTNYFIVLLLINGAIVNISAGFDESIQASGHIKKNQIGYTIINLSLLPILYVLYKIGLPPYANVVAMIVLTIVTLFFQSWIMSQQTSFNCKNYICNTILPCVLTTLIALAPLLLLNEIFDDEITSTIIKLSISFFWTILAIFYIGINKHERKLATSYILGKSNRK